MTKPTPALCGRLDNVDLPGYTEAERIAITETHLIPAPGPGRRPGGHAVAGIRQLTRCLQTTCRKVALGLEAGGASLVRDRITAGACSSQRAERRSCGLGLVVEL